MNVTTVLLDASWCHHLSSADKFLIRVFATIRCSLPFEIWLVWDDVCQPSHTWKARICFSWFLQDLRDSTIVECSQELLSDVGFWTSKIMLHFFCGHLRYVLLHIRCGRLSNEAPSQTWYPLSVPYLRCITYLMCVPFSTKLVLLYWIILQPSSCSQEISKYLAQRIHQLLHPGSQYSHIS